ncbi:MAG: relaxase/mobilization nuclease domain-containing protein [Ferruginibacter sp.]
MSKALNYNEQKVTKGTAEIMSASGFIKTLDTMNFYDKQRFFERYTSLNHQATTNVLHVSLNFDPSEKLANEKMIAVAREYMERIGFGSQPYLVYRHHDAGHPHLHIVSTNIKDNGERISMHRLGAYQSERARKEIEIEFGLVKAESKKQVTTKLVPVDASKVIRGKSEIKSAISNVLMQVLNDYKFASLHELNAVLGLYNVNAERGDPDSKMFKNNGLVYRVLDEKGNKVGTPIKASLFYMKPTLKMLEQKFVANESQKEPLKKYLLGKLAWTMHQSPTSFDAFIKDLRQEGIHIVIRKGKEDVVYGLTYVDIRNKVVFNGSDLGKQYSAKAVMQTFAKNQTIYDKENTLNLSRTELCSHIQENIKEETWKIGPLLPEAKMPYEPIPYSMKIKKKLKKKMYMRI